mmetsp:Transcript_2972/g.6059  ORF Transcript_2972/g.6059 Transcript_2972/m.6059 type:complete len:316 (-) Transcript_2972:1857-2804(-)
MGRKRKRDKAIISNSGEVEQEQDTDEDRDVKVSAPKELLKEPPSKKRKKKKKKKKKPPKQNDSLSLEKVQAEKDDVKPHEEETEPDSDREDDVDAKPIEQSFPYPTDADDHCESPKEAYENIQSFLLALRPDKQSKFRIYDPYYCDGAVVRNFAELGFPDVYNQKEDCYRVWAGQKLPQFDLLVTNPPYSGDHIEKLMKFITSKAFGNRPWLLLLPNWVHKKDYFLTATRNIHPFYIVPRKRYVYLPPKGFREAKKSDIHKKSSPFISMWYIWGGTKAVNDKLLASFKGSKIARDGSCDMARSKSALRDLRRKKR